MVKVTLEIPGMMCGMCESHVNDAIRKVGNYLKIKTSRHTGTSIMILKDESKIEDIINEIKKGGYDVKNVKIEPYEKKGLFYKL